MRNWLLPEYIEDVLPRDAYRIEKIRRLVMDKLFVHGYQFVMPPLLEYVESLLAGSGSGMNLRMFKVVDQLSGRMMGLRADMTPQAARIDAHLLNTNGVTRLCYASSVVHTVPDEITRTREPFQVGAELYGHSGIESDLEIQRLLLECLSVSGIQSIHLDLGHIRVFRSLIYGSGIRPEFEMELYAALWAKDTSALRELVYTGLNDLDKTVREALLLLPELYGDETVLLRARKYLPNFPEIREALDQLEHVAKALEPYVDRIIFDLADLRGYHYHTGMVFAAYTQGSPVAIALGGRYDEIGKSFGRARPATGFSLDLKQLSRLTDINDYPRGILAPWKPQDDALAAMIKQLRIAGHIVVTELPGENSKEVAGCDRNLVLRNGKWEICPVSG
ncbi:ATP phosphoribosyltransferase regulatory subunit [Nitrosomonas eutropha]|uniref:ATP phosphoribosyltransferase regulatory subunit n=1 Tax=Nitrosomonas TaxID=914 RepID=UPI0008824725|nr:MULTISPECIES: ATP phosphoribosyltransferase regulatory subunit [Nitrosomonas]MXS79281.1 ATP phosphoribosyltransferase regulatory subunit [Nitrosomonas sp. GH22]SCX18523.1 ATP phosphoribosyltransferase regulatory subunit [Nitrosomonas eutropha]SDW63213.1 ATP phosphoribosyltransferase regulatory subunit [Nitrosomonas eutropha]